MKNILLVLILFILSSCLFNKVTGTSHDTESSNEISLKGRVVDENNNPNPGVWVSLAKKGYSDTTDENGEYRIEMDSVDIDTNLTQGVDTLDTLIFVKDSQIVANINVTKWIDTLPDVKIIQRDISGKLDSVNQPIGKVEAVLTGDLISTEKPVVAEFYYSGITKAYSGFIYFPASEIKQNYTVFINVYGQDGKLIGRSEVFPFNSLAGDITIPTFNPGNAIPTVNAGPDTTLRIYDTLDLKGRASDLFGGSIDKWEWDIGGNNNFRSNSSGDTTIILPAQSDSNYLCVLRVTDNDGNISIDTLVVTVVTDPPVAKIITVDSVEIGSNISLSSSASTPGTLSIIEKIEWSIGSYTNFFQRSEIDTTVLTPLIANDSFVIVLRVSNDRGLSDLDTAYITIHFDVGGLPDSWTPKKASPIARAGAAAGTIDGLIYVVGGDGGNGFTSSLTVYNPKADIWEYKDSMPTARHAVSAGVANGKLYVFGGLFGGVFLNTVEEYDPILDKWTVKDTMPTRRHSPSVLEYNNKIYVMGGHNGTDLVVNEVFDPVANTWETKKPMPNARNYHGAAEVNDKIYLFGGRGNGPYVSGTDVYDIINDQWVAQVKSIPTSRDGLVVGVINNKIHVIGGGLPNNIMPIHEVYDPLSNNWSTLKPMSTARWYPAAVTLNGKIFVIGGSYNGYRDELEIYTP